MNSKIFRLSLRDVGVGLLIAVCSAVFAYLSSATDIDTSMIIKLAISSAAGYLSTAFATDENGKIMGKI